MLRGEVMRRASVVALAFALLLVVPALPAFAEAEPGPAGVGLVDTAQGMWYLRDPGSGETTSFFYGNPGDEPFMGDWDCDGIDTPGLYRRADGYVYLRNSNTQGIADVAFYFGNPGDLPLPGDFDGDGCDTVSIYRPAEALVYVINRLGAGDKGLGAADFFFRFGNPGDPAPFAGDFDGDGVDTVGMFRPKEQKVHLRNGPGRKSGVASYAFGSSHDTVVVGAWTGGADLLAAHRAGVGAFFLADAARGPLAEIAYGNDAHRPVAGHFGDLPGGDQPPPDQPAYPNVGRGKRIIYSNSEQRVWLIEASGVLAKTHPVSGRRGVPAPGTYSVFSKSRKAYAGHHGITMANMVRFAHGRSLAIGFHAIPRYPDGRPLQTVDELGSYRSAGCVRQKDADAAFLYDWAGIGTTVIVLP